MKPLAVTFLFVIVFTFAMPVSAQCIDYASCVGAKAEIDARLRPWAQETVQAKVEERRAVATERAYNRMIALTATEMARPTRTPAPTVTAQPSATSLPAVTPQPTPSATVIQVIVIVTNEPIQPVTVAPAAPWWLRWVVTAIGVPVLLVAMFWILARFRRVI